MSPILNSPLQISFTYWKYPIRKWSPLITQSNHEGHHSLKNSSSKISVQEKRTVYQPIFTQEKNKFICDEGIPGCFLYHFKLFFLLFLALLAALDDFLLLVGSFRPEILLFYCFTVFFWGKFSHNF